MIYPLTAGLVYWGSFNTCKTYILRRYNLFSCSAYNQETIQIIAIPRYPEYSLVLGLRK